MQLLSITYLFGFGIWSELLERRVSDKWIETESDGINYEVWLFGRMYIVISNERALAKLKATKL